MSRKSIQRALFGLEDDGSPETSASRDADSSCSEIQKTDEGRPHSNVAGSDVYVIDSHSLIFQVFHALHHQEKEITSPSGEPVGAVFGFTRDILYLLHEKKPDYLFCAFDLPGKTFRHELFADYKIQREEMPEDLRPQISSIRRLLGAMDIPILECESFEADDVLATVAKNVESLGGQCYLVTADKDCRQLISDKVKLYNIRKDEVFDAPSLERDWGISPRQVVDYQTLVGDPVDNVPGVPLIGPKIAGELLRKYGTLENVFEHADEVAGPKRRQNLIENREQALVSRQLVRLRDSVPIEIDWDAGRVGAINDRQVLDLFREFGFRSLAQRLEGLDTETTTDAWRAEYHTVTSLQQLHHLVEEMSHQGRISFDTETTDLRPRQARIVGYSVAWREGESYYIPVLAPEGEPCLDPVAALEALRVVLENAQIEKVGQNLKYDMLVLRCAGVQLRGAAFDTMVASYLLDAGARNHNLDVLAKHHLNHDTIKIKDLIGTGKRQIRMDQVSVEQITAYAAEDADVALRLVPILEPRLRQEHLDGLFGDLEMPLIEVLVDLEYNGIRVDVDRLRALSQRYGQRLDELEQDVYRLASHSFNIASPKQLAKVLFEELNLPVLKKTKTGPSTDSGVLDQLALIHELPAKVIEYRQYAKLKSTYVDALPDLVHPETGRIHSSFNQVVTATGRLSSTDPNLQNIPIRTEVSREIRSAFLPDPDGWTLLSADYSQIELRVLAHFSADEALRAAFANDEDIHARVASEVYGAPLHEVTGEMRRRAKAINFGVIYGQSPFGLAKSLRIEKDQAAEFIAAYFARYPGVLGFFERILAECRHTGYVSTILGRRRRVQGVRDSSVRGDSLQRNLPERTAINTVIQGSAADLIKLAMIHVYRRLRREGFEARMLLQIHDELLFEVPAAKVGELSQIVATEMSGVGELSVPLKVDVKSGNTWADCESIT